MATAHDKKSREAPAALRALLFDADGDDCRIDEDTIDLSKLSERQLLWIDLQDNAAGDAAPILERLLARLGLEEGRQALAKLEEVRPALVLLDVMMPGMDGWEVARVIKNHPQFGKARVVMLTARSDFADKHEGLRAGADDYLVKPIQLEELGRRVERNLKARESSA